MYHFYHTDDYILHCYIIMRERLHTLFALSSIYVFILAFL